MQTSLLHSYEVESDTLIFGYWPLPDKRRFVTDRLRNDLLLAIASFSYPTPMSADSTPERHCSRGSPDASSATTPIYERGSHGHWPTGLRPASDRKLGVRASRIDGQLPANT